MTTDLNTVLSQKRELDIFADNLREARTQLIRHKDSLDTYWQAAEIEMIDDMIDKINRKLNQVADELNDIGIDILKTYQELEEEERIEREKEEEEARAAKEQKNLH